MITELQNELKIPKDIVITSHRNPDGDAIGSSLGLYHFLIQEGHSVKVMFPSEYPNFLAWLEEADKILIHDIEPEVCNRYIKQADIIFCLDYNALDRVDKMGEAIANANGFKAMIDHHLFPENFADYVLSETSASSTCELIFDFIALLKKEYLINETVAECLFTGILTDTGNFKYATSSKLYRIVANLHDLGVNPLKVQNHLNNTQSEKRLAILGHSLAQRMEVIDEFHTGIITLTKQDHEHFNIERGDTEGIVNYLLTLKQVKMAIFVKEQQSIIKLSFRSKGEFSCQEVASDHFNGGGHKNASGGYFHGSLRNLRHKIFDILPLYKEKLTKAKEY